MWADEITIAIWPGRIAAVFDSVGPQPATQTTYDLDLESDEIGVVALPSPQPTCRLIDYLGIRCIAPSSPVTDDLCTEHLADILDLTGHWINHSLNDLVRRLTDAPEVGDQPTKTTR
jgi:hypothetical protein